MYVNLFLNSEWCIPVIYIIFVWSTALCK